MKPITHSDPIVRGRMDARWRVLAESVWTALVVYVVAGASEAALIRALRPTELELTWVSDIVLSAAFGTAVYLWRHLLATRRELSERERAELVIQAQLSLAGEMQRRLLPPVPPSANGFEWAAVLTPAGKIGGDFYDFVEQSPAVWLALIADVSGKGVPAAMALGVLRSTFRTLAREGLGPAQLVARLSAAVQDEWLGTPYVTCIAAKFETNDRRLTYTNAGHPAGVIIGARANRYLNRGGPPVGLLPGARFEQEMVDLRAGDICLLVTDGVTEALEDGAQPALDAIASTARNDSGSAVGICNAVIARALRGQGPPDAGHWDDDRTVLAVTVRDA